jgi:predicted regulator of Ras-like GTPase activity (Roadblock/LC7/MglB family)
MPIPFLSYFKKGKGSPVEEAPKPVTPPLDKPSSERFSKTVMPNATRTLAPQDPFELAAHSTALGGQMSGMPTAGAPLPPPLPAAPRTISFSPSSAAVSAQRDLPPAVALALEPQVERVLSLQLADVLTEMPEGYCKPNESIDTTRRVLLKASEVEKGMATGSPSVSLASVYQQMPEIFIRKIEESDTAQLKLPFKKVLEGFASMQVRGDQERAGAVPQVETPFLKVTLEDNQTFGTTTEPAETTEMPPMRLQPPTAAAFAAAEPEEVAEAIRKMTAPPASTNGAAPKIPARIPFKFSPNGTDASVSESVPASSGPSVPNLLPSPLAPAPEMDAAAKPEPEKRETKVPPPTYGAAPTPVRIPFKMAPLTPIVPLVDEAPKPKPEPWLTKESVAAASETPVEAKDALPVVSEPPRVAEGKIALPLLPILKSLPPIQLTGDPSCVPADVRLELPFALIEPQLASGRVSVTAKVFEVSMPMSFRGLFQAGEGTLDVSLPLQEVLKNLPTTSLRMRDDQEEQEAGQNFATPFSAKADEDAKRFNVPAVPVAKPAMPELKTVESGSPRETEAADTAATTGEGKAVDTAAATREGNAADTAAATEEKERSSDRPLRTPLQVALDTDEKLDAKGVVALVNKIPGVKACSIMFGDGLSLAGSLPTDLETDGICAMAPSLLQRVETHLADTKLGLLRGMTLSCVKGVITFYMQENLCLAALHANGDLPGETRDKLSRVLHELSRKYSHPV